MPSSTGLVGVADLGEVAGGELVGVDDDRRAAGDVGEVGLEGRGVHRDEHVGGVAGGEDVVVGEVQLEAGDAGEGALGGADLRGEVGQRRQVVAHRRGLAREPVARELHPVPRVTGETDHHAVERLDGLAAHWSPWSVGGGGSGAAPRIAAGAASSIVRRACWPVQRCPRIVQRASTELVGVGASGVGCGRAWRGSGGCSLGVRREVRWGPTSPCWRRCASRLGGSPRGGRGSAPHSRWCAAGRVGLNDQGSGEPPRGSGGVVAPGGRVAARGPGGCGHRVAQTHAWSDARRDAMERVIHRRAGPAALVHRSVGGRAMSVDICTILTWQGDGVREETSGRWARWQLR